MSVVQSAMFRDQLNSFARGTHHSGTSFNELLAQFKSRITTQKLTPVTPVSRTPPGYSESSYVKKRSYSDQANESEPLLQDLPNKRSRTAPPSPPSLLHQSSSFPSHLSASGRLESPETHRSARITLPSLSDALNGIRSLPPPRHSKPIVPTVSLDYFDTYKPNDENWRYGLLDSIKSSKPSFNLSKYSYLNKHAEPTSPNLPTRLPSIQLLEAGQRPHFDARVSSKALPALAERKINFPYESNYTYLNKTYLTDVERYPEYLELAQSLIQLSKPQLYSPQQPYYSTVHRHDDGGHHNHECGYDHRPQPNHTPVNNRHDPHPASHYNTPKEPYYNFLTSPSASRLPQLSPMAYATPDNSFDFKVAMPKKDKKTSLQRTRFIPITPPSVKDKTRSELMKSPPRSAQAAPRVCISCGSDQSPCWRPSWSIKEGQLCNSCGLRYKKTATRCLNDECKKIPAKGEWSLMQTKGKTQFDDGTEAYSCLDCGWKVEVKK